MRKGRTSVLAVVVLAASAAVAGCDDGKSADGLVIEGTPAARPYRGALHVKTRAAEDDRPESPRRASGAAGLALECTGELYGGGGSDSWSEGDGGGSPEEGLRAYFDIEQPELPERGWRVEREEKARVLYSFDVGEKTKAAVIVARDQPGRPGWGPETSAWCDPAEFPASFTDDQPYEIWTDADGRRVPVSRLSSGDGPEHCQWQRAHFLDVSGRLLQDLGVDDKRKDKSGDAKGAMYARDPEKKLSPSMLTSRYRRDATLPEDAKATGYRRGDWTLWLAADGSTAYVRTADGVEAWPKVKGAMVCK